MRSSKEESDETATDDKPLQRHRLRGCGNNSLLSCLVAVDYWQCIVQVRTGLHGSYNSSSFYLFERLCWTSRFVGEGKTIVLLDVSAQLSEGSGGDESIWDSLHFPWIVQPVVQG